MSERKDEAYCRRSFARWLSVQYPGLAQEWCYEPNGQQTPDYQLRLGGREFAVEVTRVSMPETSAVYSIDALCEECQSEAKSRGILHGTYLALSDRSFFAAVRMTKGVKGRLGVGFQVPVSG
jgi:hypothetical protein